MIDTEPHPAEHNPLPHHGDLVPQYHELQEQSGSWPAGVPTYSPEELAGALTTRPNRRSGIRMSDGPDARAKINLFQRASFRTRPLEALTPGGSTEHDNYVRTLSFTHRTDQRKEIYNRDEQCKETVFKHRWSQGQFSIAPKCLDYTTSLTCVQKTLLRILYDKATDGANVWYFHKHGRLRVEGVTLEYLAHHTGLSIGYVSKQLHAASEEGFLQIHQRGNQQTNVYYLAKQENASWTYPAGSKDSARARIQRHVGESLENINWEAVRTQRFARKRKNASYRAEADEREQDAQKRRAAAAERAKNPSAGDGAADEVDWDMAVRGFLPDHLRSEWEKGRDEGSDPPPRGSG